jgi:hypothetical protein
MKWLRYVVTVVCALGVGCASDGGPAGTGVSTTAAISGNVVEVQTNTTTATTATVRAALPPIRVSIDGLPDLATTADGAGNFALSGDFAGSITLRFTVPQFQVTQQLDVPAGSAVVLQDIALQPDGVVPQAVRQLDFFGTVDLVDCADGTLLIHERRSDGMQFLVHVDDQTSFVDASGQAQSCAAIRVGKTVEVQGAIAYSTDRTITALVVTIAPQPPPPPQPMSQVSFSGVVAAIDCTAGYVVIDDSTQRTSVRLTTATHITDASGRLSCADLEIGDPVRGQGQINLRMPGTIGASTIVVTGPPPGKPLRFNGFVTMIDCSSGLLQLNDVTNAIDVQLLPATVITRNDQTVMCTDIQLGNRVMGTGQVDPTAPDVIDATRITVTHGGSHPSMRH